MRAAVLAVCFAVGGFFGGVAVAEDPAAIPLWPNGAPGARADGGEPKVRVVERGERVVSNIHAPSITPFLPEPAAATGCAIVVVPGGGHKELWADHEGYNLARWLRDHGVAAFVVLYRLAKEENSTYTVDGDELGDVQRAIRTVRARADEWHLNPKHVGVLGFSAGGELAALAGMNNDAGQADAADVVDRQSCRPDFQALIYPGRSARYTVSDQSPPVFIACGFQDRQDIAHGMAEVYLKYKEAGVPAELHIFSDVGHGFGVREGDHGAYAQWTAMLKAWLDDRGMLAQVSK